MIDYPITWVAGSGGEELEVRIIHGGVPQFSVKHEIQGEDSYTYDIIFTGKHLGNVAAVTATNAGCTFSQFGGMTFGLDTEVTQEGGSMQQLVIELSSSTAMPLDTKYKYFKLAYLPTDAVSDGLSYGHGDQLTNLETFFDATYAAGTFSTDYILKSGNGTAEEGFGFQYTVTFQDGLGSMQVPFLLQDGEFTDPLFTPYPTNGVGQINDLEVQGAFTHTADYAVFEVKIKSTDPANAVDEFSFSCALCSSVYSHTDGDIAITEVDTGVVGEETGYSRVWVTLADGIQIKFDRSRNHTVDSTWKFIAVRVDDTLPETASLSLTVTNQGN
jgi:hypothetical protein